MSKGSPIIPFRLPPEDLERLKFLSRVTGVSVSQLVRRAVIMLLDGPAAPERKMPVGRPKRDEGITDDAA